MRSKLFAVPGGYAAIAAIQLMVANMELEHEMPKLSALDKAFGQIEGIFCISEQQQPFKSFEHLTVTYKHIHICIYTYYRYRDRERERTSLVLFAAVIGFFFQSIKTKCETNGEVIL